MAFPAPIVTSDAVTAYRTYINALLGSRGKFIQAIAGTRTNTSYGALSNGPDVVSGVVLPTDGILVVAFQALMQAPVSQNANAAIFLGANQLKTPTFPAPAVNEITLGSDATPNWCYVASSLGGLYIKDSGGVNDASNVTTGQTLAAASLDPADASLYGSPCYIFAAAGTYDVSVQFKSAAGTLNVKERKLWVWTMGF